MSEDNRFSCRRNKKFKRIGGITMRLGCLTKRKRLEDKIEDAIGAAVQAVDQPLDPEAKILNRTIKSRLGTMKCVITTTRRKDGRFVGVLDFSTADDPTVRLSPEAYIGNLESFNQMMLREASSI